MLKSSRKMLVFSFVLAALPVLAQGSASSPAGSPGCGDDKVNFEVKTSKSGTIPRPETGRALVYLIEDDSDFNSSPNPTIRAGLDGQWVGATHGNSYLYFEVDPGEHHFCASWQGRGSKAAASSFTAEVGSVYYFVAKNTFYQRENSSNKLALSLTQLNSDEGRLMVSRSAFSVSKKK
jgi:hypothetical protein